MDSEEQFLLREEKAYYKRYFIYKYYYPVRFTSNSTIMDCVSTESTSLLVNLIVKENLLTLAINSKGFLADFYRRCHLESALLKATMLLPDNGGLSVEKIRDMHQVLDRNEPPLPKNDTEFAVDDFNR